MVSKEVATSRAIAYKESGNSFVQKALGTADEKEAKKLWTRAAREYKLIFCCIGDARGDANPLAALSGQEGTAPSDEVLALRAAAYANLALCSLKRGLHGDAVTFASHSLDINRHQPRVLYRRAAAHFALGRFDEALADSTLALQDPSASSDGALRALHANISAAAAKAEARSDEFMGKAMSKLFADSGS